ncbi:EamA family transporter [Actinomadura scrupuli]|uniref:EamA family transporter n=1 Tax=Actinomadura scrupuli TaxID=559629 RepID=UPI003D99D5A2
MALPIGPVLAVLFAGVLHAVWNAVAKGVPDRQAGFALIGLGQTAVGLVLLPLVPVPALASWPWLAASTLLQLGYVMLLARSYDLGDFGQVYPLARGSAPLLVAAVAAVALGERLGPVRFAGVAAICGGLAALAFAGGLRLRRSERPAVYAALLTGVSIAAYTLVDGVGVRLSGSATGYMAWMFAIEGPLIVVWVLVLRGRGLLPAMRAHAPAGTAGGLIAAVAYGIALWAQTRGSLAAVAALRETGVISGAIIGAVFFAEPMGRRRILAACVVAFGVVLLNAR